MAQVADVAAYILEKCGPMTAMKLQKLVYYSQAWHLVWTEKPLFDNRIEAWANGPVVWELYDLPRTLLGRIRAIETMTEFEAFNYGEEPGKDYAVADLPTKAAQDRLVELEYDDEDQISRLRVTGSGRLYGFRRAERFYALWWDPEHTIWPSRKKHT